MIRARSIEYLSNFQLRGYLPLKYISPFYYFVNFETWKQSFINDVDGNGRLLFKKLYIKAV